MHTLPSLEKNIMAKLYIKMRNYKSKSPMRKEPNAGYAATHIGKKYLTP
jgi:hypothetical protein